jgi:Double zinc ribbon
MRCPSCNASLTQGSNFCEQCGTVLPRPCPSCAHANSAKAKFCSKCCASLASETSQPISLPSSRPASTTPTPTAERRHLTIMFCDMVGSSVLSTPLDPEEQRDVVSAFQSCCANEIKRLDGMVAQYLGDGVLA